MNQSTFVFGALAGFVAAAVSVAVLLGVWRTFARLRASASDGWVPKIFAQWPTTALVLDPVTGNVIAANPAALKSLGYSQAEIRKLPFTQLFTSEAVEATLLVARLKESTARAPIELRQHCRDGSVRKVEASSHELTLDEREVLAISVLDVTERRVAETQLLEKSAASRSPRATTIS